MTFGYIKTPITYIDWPIEHTPDRSILTFIRAKILAERLKNGCNVTPIAARRKIESTLMFHGVGTGDMSAHAESFLSKTRSQYAWGLPTTHAYAWGPRPFNYLNLPSNLRIDARNSVVQIPHTRTTNQPKNFGHSAGTIAPAPDTAPRSILCATMCEPVPLLGAVLINNLSVCSLVSSSFLLKALVQTMRLFKGLVIVVHTSWFAAISEGNSCLKLKRVFDLFLKR